MHIRRAIPADREVLFDIWLHSVQATHTFVSEEDIQSFIPLVQDYLASSEPEFWVLCSDSGAAMGFMGMAGNKIDALFLAPEFHRRGGGRRLVQHAQALWGQLTVDVNEQNWMACRFYEACGFVVEGRSELDDAGRPYPLLHMRLRPPTPATGQVEILEGEDNKMNMNSVAQIANLLSQAGSAHHHFEQTVLNGVYDQEWPAWYADYVIKHGLNDLLPKPVTVEQLSHFFSESYEIYKLKNSPLGWADYTAQEISQRWRNEG